MKKLLLTLLLCFGVTAFACDCSCDCEKSTTELSADCQCDYDDCNCPTEDCNCPTEDCNCPTEDCNCPTEDCNCPTEDCNCEPDPGCTCVGAEANAELVFEVPAGMIKTWNVTNYEHGFVFDLYEERLDDQKENLLMVGKMPLCACPEIDVESVVPMVIEALGIHAEATKEDGAQPIFNIDVLPELVSGDFFAKRFQLSLLIDGEEAEIVFDTHLFFKGGVMYMVATGMSPEVDQDELLTFTEEVMNTVNFE